MNPTQAPRKEDLLPPHVSSQPCHLQVGVSAGRTLMMKSTLSDLRKMADVLLQAALESGGEDNVSVIVVEAAEGDGTEDLFPVQLLAKPDSIKMPHF